MKKPFQFCIPALKTPQPVMPYFTSLAKRPGLTKVKILLVLLHRVLGFCGFHWCGFHSCGVLKYLPHANFMHWFLSSSLFSLTLVSNDFIQIFPRLKITKANDRVYHQFNFMYIFSFTFPTDKQIKCRDVTTGKLLVRCRQWRAESRLLVGIHT